MKRNISIEEKALIKAAKLICDLKSGLCPIHEPGFSGCPQACTGDIRPWQCWKIHLTTLARNQNNPDIAPPLKHAA